MTIEDARAYVGTTPLSGLSQLRLLLHEGLRTDSRVLEYGCGTLHLARPLVATLDPGCYVGVDPNRWLVDAALADEPDLGVLLEARGALLFSNDDFRAPDGRRFDLVFAHSVVSHMAGDQLGRFFYEAARALDDNGRVLFSYRAGPNSDAAEWTYPDATFFSTGTIADVARRNGLDARFMASYRELHSAVCPDEVHDWCVLTVA